MALLNIFKPKWQHSNPSVRLNAVRKLCASDAEILSSIVKNDLESSVRLAALSQINDLSRLRSLRDDSEFPADLMDDVVREINTQLVQVILQHPELEIKRAAIVELDSPDGLVEVALKVEELEFRLEAVKKIIDPELLLTILQNNCGREPGLAAVEKISDLTILGLAAKNGSSKHIRAAAQEKISRLAGPTPEEVEAAHRQEVLGVLAKAEKLTVLPDPERASSEFHLVENQWQDFQGNIVEEYAQRFKAASDTINKRLLNFQKHAGQQQQEVQSRTKQISDLFSILEEMALLIDCPDDAATSAFTSKSKKYRKLLKKIAEPPLELTKKAKSVQQKYSFARNIYKSEELILKKLLHDLQIIDKNLINNDISQLDIMLCDLRDSLAMQSFQIISISEIEERVALAQNSFTEAKRKADEMAANDAKIRLQNLEGRVQLLQEIKDLDEMPDRLAAENRIKEIKKIWLNPQRLPEDKSRDIDKDFHELLDRFYVNQKTYFEERDWQSWNSRNSQEKLIAEMVDLAKENDLYLVFKTMRSLQEKWKETGSCRPKDAKGLWNRFHDASELQFKRCQEFFAELDKKSLENLAKKTALIDRARVEQESEQWQKTTDFFRLLQEEWKSIGRAPKDKEDEIFKEFRGVCDHFFNRRTAHYKELEAKRLENLEKKEALCQAIEKLLVQPEESHIREIKQFQVQWKEIGAAPKDKENEIWFRFRGLCDQYFQWYDALKPENLQKKENLCQRLTEAIATLDDDMANIGKISGTIISLQKEWRTIGPAPKEENDKIWSRFRAICDGFFDLRKKHYDAIDQQRPANEERKNEIIKQVLGVSQTDSRAGVKRIITLQEEWKKIGAASKKNDLALEHKFKELCDRFFQSRRQHFEELDEIRRENLKKKEELCIRLELIAGVQQPKRPGSSDITKSSLTLAEQLKLAFESNFIMAGDDKSSKRRKKDEVKQIELEWQQIGEQVPKEHMNYIKKRYEKAVKACESLPN